MSVGYHVKLVGDATANGITFDTPFRIPWGTVVGQTTWYDPSGMSGTHPPTETLHTVVRIGN
ncbi:hypothetical protein [Streptomyces gibsoniae]|uniref:Uncharacterized protein n=1 Tax=Streptomyces gibsoniae TaxID=3075529 RepID=A0ABU2TX07_9ACTN|nr:hypothetical protein [Streptomyces sp. DSM 41699]MDT0465500.1 hypothetical protein [Streptomyces sp. DSM 41699]